MQSQAGNGAVNEGVIKNKKITARCREKVFFDIHSDLIEKTYRSVEQKKMGGRTETNSSKTKVEKAEMRQSYLHGCIRKSFR